MIFTKLNSYSHWRVTAPLSCTAQPSTSLLKLSMEAFTDTLPMLCMGFKAWPALAYTWYLRNWTRTVIDALRRLWIVQPNHRISLLKLSMEAFTDTFPMLCMGFKAWPALAYTWYYETELLQSLTRYGASELYSPTIHLPAESMEAFTDTLPILVCNGFKGICRLMIFLPSWINKILKYVVLTEKSTGQTDDLLISGLYCVHVLPSRSSSFYLMTVL